VDYLLVKWVHVLSSTILFGTGIGTAFYLLVSSLSRDVPLVAGVTRWVVRADWLFTATTIVLQPLTGLWLVWRAGFQLTSTWVAWSIALYVVAVACWLPVVWLQMRLRDLAAEAHALEKDLSPAYWRCFRWWFALGVPALVAFLAVFWLMVARPA